MENNKRKNDNISNYLEDREYIANTYVLRCFSVTMVIYFVTFILNLIGVFIIEQTLMFQGFFVSLPIYIIVYLVSKKGDLSDERMKYFILFGVVLVFTIIGVTITYHVVLISLLPFLYATLYSSKPVMRYVYILTVISTIVVVYRGYFFGLCDANMVLLTTNRLSDYVVNGEFLLTQVNENPFFNLLLFFVIPRCLIYIAFVFVCNSIFEILSGSLEKAKLTAALEKAKTEAENANRAKSQFLAKVSHEIRTPINAVLGMNEMILRESAEENTRKYALDVKNSSMILLNLINDILDTAKIESGKMEIVNADYEMGSLLNDLYNMISIKAKEKNLKLIFDIEPSIPRKYYGDVKRIGQVVLNLLTNAVKYTKKGEVLLKVSAKVEGENARITYAVKDTGIGIRKEDIEKIYDEFQRFDMSENRHVEGTGLGMNIVRQFLLLMGSDLHIESEYGRGSEFSFEIIQKILDKEPLGDFRKRIDNAENKKQHQQEFTAPDARVLVVDDYPMNLKVFCGLLKQTEIQVCEATSGIECLELLREQKFDLVFLDHMMPDLDGIETFRYMREEKLCKNIPVIMLTANAIVGDRDKYMQEGFDDFLSKPILPEKLNQMLLKYLPKHMICLKEEIDREKSQEEILSEIRRKIPQIQVDTGLSAICHDVGFYLELLKDFAELSVKEELTELLNNGDFENYCIRVHGFKNTAYYMGAMELGDLAYEMETCTKDGFTDTIYGLQADLFQQYDRICQEYIKITTM